MTFHAGGGTRSKTPRIGDKCCPLSHGTVAGSRQVLTNAWPFLRAPGKKGPIHRIRVMETSKATQGYSFEPHHPGFQQFGPSALCQLPSLLCTCEHPLASMGFGSSWLHLSLEPAPGDCCSACEPRGWRYQQTEYIPDTVLEGPLAG